MLEVVLDTLKDSIKLLPFLFVAYLIMECIEHKTSNKTKEMVQKSDRYGALSRTGKICSQSICRKNYHLRNLNCYFSIHFR